MIQTPVSGTCFITGYISHQNVYGHSFPSAALISILPFVSPVPFTKQGRPRPDGFSYRRSHPSCSRRGTPCPGNSFTPSRPRGYTLSPLRGCSQNENLITA